MTKYDAEICLFEEAASVKDCKPWKLVVVHTVSRHCVCVHYSIWFVYILFFFFLFQLGKDGVFLLCEVLGRIILYSNFLCWLRLLVLHNYSCDIN